MPPNTHTGTCTHKYFDYTKLNSPGVGCSKSHADNWIAHQDVFNELLSSLNDAPSSSAAGSEETPSVVSLEEKSKSSRSRVQ